MSCIIEQSDSMIRVNVSQRKSSFRRYPLFGGEYMLCRQSIPCRYATANVRPRSEGNHPSVAKAGCVWHASTARLKSCRSTQRLKPDDFSELFRHDQGRAL